MNNKLKASYTMNADGTFNFIFDIPGNEPLTMENMTREQIHQALQILQKQDNI